MVRCSLIRVGRFDNGVLAVLLVLAGWCLPQAGACQEPERWPRTLAETTEFTPDDQVVSNPNVPMVDPEFDQVGYWLAWQIGPNPQADGVLRVAKVDPDTGDLLDPDTLVPLNAGGTSLEVDTGLVSREVTKNGPEWAFGIDGSQILYTKANANLEPSLARATFDGVDWVPELLASGQNRLSPEGSKNPDDTFPLVAYIGFVPGPDGLERRLGVRLIDIAATERITPATAGGGNFVPGDSAFITLAASQSGLQQVFMFDYDVELFEQITQDSGGKLQAPDIWRAPEFADELMFAVIVGFSGTRTARIYRENPDMNGDPTWTLHAVIRSPNQAKPFVGSARSFVHAGKSYIALKAMVAAGSNADAEIWIVDIEREPVLRFARQISSGAPGSFNHDPEPFMTTLGPIVYYSEVTPEGISVLHRAATGL